MKKIAFNLNSVMRSVFLPMAALLACFIGSMPAQAQTNTAPTAMPAEAAISSYRINPGDLLEVFVWGEERLQRELTVLPDGTIAFPLAGQLRVAGRVPQEVEAMLTERLGPQYRGEVPSITVSVRVPSGMRYSVLGKVRSPGTFSTSRYVNVLEALSQAGGADEFSKLDSILVIRGTGPQAQTFRVRLDDLFRSGASERTIRQAGIIQIEPGDVIIVP